MRLLKVKHFRQRPSYCGPASLKILFSFYGVQAGELKLGKLARCTVKNGTDHIGMIKAAKAFGFKAYVKEHATFADIDNWVNKKKTPVIVGWFSDYDDHYSVVIGLDKTHIALDDPEMAKPVRHLKRSFFKHVWFDFIGKNNDRVSWGWMMAIQPNVKLKMHN
jgi:predicted double-glycine peptidase